MFLWLTVGAILGALFIRFARSRSPDGQLRVFAVGLVVAAVIYVGFALADGVEWMALEAAGVGLFVLLAYAGLRRSPLLLALGWTVHVGWDVGLHLARQQVVVPAWYPSVCISFDLHVARVLQPRRRQIEAWLTPSTILNGQVGRLASHSTAAAAACR